MRSETVCGAVAVTLGAHLKGTFFFKHGSLDSTRDEEVLEWLNVADSSTDPDERIEYYTKAIQKIADEAFWAPMFTYNTNYVFSQDVSYTPTPDEVLRFVDMSWN